MSTLTSQATARDPPIQATADVGVQETHTATQTPRHLREATETTEEGTEIPTDHLHREIRTASETRMTDVTDPDARAAEAPSTTTTAGPGCRIARKTFMHARSVLTTLTGDEENTSKGAVGRFEMRTKKLRGAYHCLLGETFLICVLPLLSLLCKEGE